MNTIGIYVCECLEWSDGEDHDGDVNEYYNYNFIWIKEPNVHYIWYDDIKKGFFLFVERHQLLEDPRARIKQTGEMCISIAKEYLSTRLEEEIERKDKFPYARHNINEDVIDSVKEFLEGC